MSDSDEDLSRMLEGLSSRSLRARIPGGYDADDNDEDGDFHKIIAGIDFGTTFTGISWVETAGSHHKSLVDVHVIHNWPRPGREADLAWKTPSRIAYASENPIQTDAFGFQVRAGSKSYTWMKLLLDTDSATKYDDPNLKRSEGSGVLSRPAGKSAVDLCADFLGLVAVYAYKELEKQVSPEIMAISPLEFWFTVPAVWSDKAKAGTLQAAEKAARQTNIFRAANVSTFLVAEPEAAAVATISAITEGGTRLQIQPDDGVLVCDCGGGTVVSHDLTTYEVVAIEPRLEFRELVVGIGGKCGSTSIDRLFLEWMDQRFGDAFKTLSWERRGPGSRFMKDFEGNKRDFGRSTDPSNYYEMMLSMPAARNSRHYNSQETMVKLYTEDMKALFDPVVKKVVSLIQSQLESGRQQHGSGTVKTVIMVGGFGDSRYLNDVVRKWCKENYPRIRVICPDHPQAAIVRGAALSGLHNLQPSSRLARRHYGFDISKPFDKMLHTEDQRYRHSWYGTDYARDLVMWTLFKGDVVTEQTHIKQSVNQIVYLDDVREDACEAIVYACDLENAPIFSKGHGVKRVATMKISVRGVDLNQFEQKTKNGRRMCMMSMSFEVQFGSRKGVLIFKAMIAGKEAGSASVTFDSDISGTGLMPEHGNAESTKSCVIQ